MRRMSNSAFQPLAVIGNPHMDLLCILLHQLEGFRSLSGFAGIELAAGEVCHLADELGVEKALVFGLSFDPPWPEGRQVRLGYRPSPKRMYRHKSTRGSR